MWGLKLYFCKKKKRNTNGQCVYEKTLGSITATTHVNKMATNENLKDTRIALMKKTDTHVFHQRGRNRLLHILMV